jgi:hypothetical protein
MFVAASNKNDLQPHSVNLSTQLKQHAYPTRNKSAKTAAQKVYNYFIFRLGYSQTIHHDHNRTITFTTLSEKLLGVQWCTEEDCFVFDCKQFLDVIVEHKENSTTKDVVRITSRIYDFVGYITPLSID